MRVGLSYCAAALSIFTHSARSACAGIAGSASATDPFWMNNGGLHVASKNAYNPGYKVFRNVKVDYHAVGDGIADDTDAINKAISDGSRCGKGCVSSSITPAIVFFPPGKYRVTKTHHSLLLYVALVYRVGDYNSKPTLIADANFVGTAVIDADPYIDGVSNPDGSGINWWTNQNNFFRSVRNFVIDVTRMPPDRYGTGVHWQVGQATSLINIDFKMSSAAGTKHQGIFMENGSGGFMSDLTFDGGAFGMWLSNQQFTIRNVKITNAVSAIYQLWNWGFTWQNIQISNCQVGFDLNTGGLTLDTQSTGGVLIVDAKISNTGIGIRMSTTQPNSLAGSVVLDNVAFSGISKANIQDSSGTVLAASAATVPHWFQGNLYLGSAKRYLRGSYTPSGSRPASLVDSSGAFFSKSRPQYHDYQDNQFFSIMAIGLGAKGDGVTDDTVAINTFLQKYSGCAILLFEAGTYLVTDTIFVPPNTIIVGDMYSVIMATGPKFADQNNPRSVIQVGNPGDIGDVEISDMVITTTGGSAGAIGIEWNIKESTQGSAGLWDVHIRLGGTKGTNINSANCPTTSTDASKCASAFLGLHITQTGSGYFENVWVWNADHDLDDPNQTQLNVFSGRGLLVESARGPVWLVGTASEHHVIYQYAFHNAQNVYAGLIQTETPYFQPTPKPPIPFAINPTYGDPVDSKLDAWGLIITNSYNIYIYGAGLYSFFQTYSQSCKLGRNCQDSMVLVDQQSSGIYLYQLTTVGSTSMITYPNVSLANQADNINGFASTLSLWEAPSVQPPQGECGPTSQVAINKPVSRDINHTLLMRQSEDYLYYSLNPGKISTDLMVGAVDGDGNRKPRNNCIFYVNQPDTPDTDPNYAKNRAIQLEALLNLENPGGDYHTLYDVYDTAYAFSYTDGPMVTANLGGHLREWFQITSKAYAELCQGRIWLVVEEREIWDQSIWMTHELDAINTGGLATSIVEVRPEDVGLAVNEFGSTRFLPTYPYRGGQPPGATTPRDGATVQIDGCVFVDIEAANAKWANVVDVSGDVSPFKEGICTFHVHQWHNDNGGGGGPFDPTDPPVYSVEITLFDDGATHKIGFQSRLATPYSMVSKLDVLFNVTVPSDDYIQFDVGSVSFKSNDGSCQVGGWDHGVDRQMDCGFPCTWGGEESTDHSPLGLWLA